MNKPLRTSADCRRRRYRNAGHRTLAVGLALALAAAACGGAETVAPEPADTTPPATTAAAAPETTAAAPAPTTTLSQAEECAAEGADDAALAAAEAREIMDAGPAGLGLQRLDELREAAQRTLIAIAIGCDGWGYEDEDRYQDIIAAAQEPDDPETVDETPVETADETGAEGDGPAAEQAPAPAPTTAPAGPAPDDPEWEDKLPEPADPDPAPVGAVLDWSDANLRPVEEGWPYVCEHTPYNCGPEGKWTSGPPTAITIGTRAQTTAVIGESRVPAGLSTRRTSCGQGHRSQVTGFAIGDAGPGGLRSVRVLLAHHAAAFNTLIELAETDPIDPTAGCAEAPPCSSGAVPCLQPTEATDRDGFVLAVLLPEHADTVTYDDDGNMTGATLLLLHAGPLH